jgi:hypothetical protein
MEAKQDRILANQERILAALAALGTAPAAAPIPAPPSRPTLLDRLLRRS